MRPASTRMSGKSESNFRGCSARAWLRSRDRHQGDHREPLAARIRLRIHVVGRPRSGRKGRRRTNSAARDSGASPSPIRRPKAVPIWMPPSMRRGGPSRSRRRRPRRGRAARLKRCASPPCPSTRPSATACRACPSVAAGVRRGSRRSAGTCSGRCAPGRRRPAPPPARRPGATPGAGCTTAFTSSPISSLGTPMTATSSTLGCITMASSISWG